MAMALRVKVVNFTLSIFYGNFKKPLKIRTNSYEVISLRSCGFKQHKQLGKVRGSWFKSLKQGTWGAQLVKRLTSAQVMILVSQDKVLHQSSCLAESLLLPHSHALSLSHSLSNR